MTYLSAELSKINRIMNINVTNILKKAKALLSSVKLSEAQLENGTVISYDGDYVDVGSVIYFKDASGEWAVLGDGDYSTKEGLKFTIKEGVVSGIDDANFKANAEKLKAENEAKLKAEQEKECVELKKLDATNLSEDQKNKLNLCDCQNKTPEEIQAEEEAKSKIAKANIDERDADFKVDVDTLIDAKLSDVWTVLDEIKKSVGLTKQDSDKTQEALSTIADVVAKLAKQPAAKQVEKEVNPFKKVTPELEENRAYKIFNSGKKD